MIADSNEGSAEEENAAMEAAASLGAAQTTAEQGAAVTPEQGAATTEKPRARTSGRRAVLRNLRENVGIISRDLSSFRKRDEASAKMLEKQVSQIRSELALLRSHISKESTDAAKRREAYVSKILAKLNAKAMK